MIPGVAVYLVTSSEEMAAAMAGLVTLAAIALIGALPGDPGPNRFGPPPPVTVRRVLTRR